MSSSAWRFRLPSTTESPDHSAERGAWCGRQAPSQRLCHHGQATQGSKSKADLVFRVLGEEPQGLGPALGLCSVFYPLFNTKYLKNSFLNPGSLPACFLNHKGAGLCFLSHYSLFHRHRSQVGEVLPGPAGLQCWGWRSPEEG